MKEGKKLPPDHNIREIRLVFEALSVYRQILSDPVMQRLYTLVDYLYREECDVCGFLGLYNNFYYALAENDTTNALANYTVEYLLFSENAFSRQAEWTALEDMDTRLLHAVKRDLHYLQRISGITSETLKEHALQHLCSSGWESKVIENLPEWEISTMRHARGDVADIREALLSSPRWEDCIESLAKFYYKNGTGIFAKYRGCIWDVQEGGKYLKGIAFPDAIRLQDLIGYEMERSVIVENTLQFLKGYVANNILLYGDRGTGKSSTVKALLHEYHAMGLRMIEIPKAYLADLPEIIRAVKDRKLFFIFFVDDLAFADSEESYTALKAILEGGLESRPRNVVIYATSNRRHLIKEKFSDRSGILSGNHEDEIRASDTLQEKLSLADRFGITVTFSSPDKYKYLAIVDGLAEQRHLDIDRETLHKEALQWEMWYNGRSPRTARQFIDWLEGKIKLQEG